MGALIDTALSEFKLEMDGQGLWNSVFLFSASDFGRTLTSNGLGTDHAWAGNHMFMGGGVKGGKIHGTYPNDLTDDGPQSIGRGRLSPTTSWEQLWEPVLEWLGITDNAKKDHVLPNRGNFVKLNNMMK